MIGPTCLTSYSSIFRNVFPFCSTTRLGYSYCEVKFVPYRVSRGKVLGKPGRVRNQNIAVSQGVHTTLLEGKCDIPSVLGAKEPAKTKVSRRLVFTLSGHSLAAAVSLARSEHRLGESLLLLDFLLLILGGGGSSSGSVVFLLDSHSRVLVLRLRVLERNGDALALVQLDLLLPSQLLLFGKQFDGRRGAAAAADGSVDGFAGRLSGLGLDLLLGRALRVLFMSHLAVVAVVAVSIVTANVFTVVVLAVVVSAIFVGGSDVGVFVGSRRSLGRSERRKIHNTGSARLQVRQAALAFPSELLLVEDSRMKCCQRCSRGEAFRGQGREFLRFNGDILPQGARLHALRAGDMSPGGASLGTCETHG
ncbi:hypothetical protein K456DRAFT_84064 [Colletotrichum gloeosporioides 23]|nr:hypothetical protein K456DRAFT_84064 [Colletotrichum gloeosporioides 23]